MRALVCGYLPALRVRGRLCFCLRSRPPTRPSARPSRPGSSRRGRRRTGRPTSMARRARRADLRHRAGRRLRVVKNGALLATPFVTVTVDSTRRARAARRRVRPELRHQPVRLRLLHGHDADDPQPRQPVHRVRRRRGRRAASRSSSTWTRSRARRTTTAGRSTSAPTASCTSPSATTRTRAQRARTLDEPSSARSSASTRDGTIPTDNPFYAHGDRHEPRDLGARPAQPVHVRLPARAPAGCSSTTSAQSTWEEINDGVAGANYGWPDTEGPTTDPRFRSPLYAYGHGADRDDGLRHHRRRVLQPADRAVPGGLRRRLLLRRLLQRLDPQARPRRRQHRRRLRDRRPRDRRPRRRPRRLRSTTSRASDGEVFRVASPASNAPTITTHPATRPSREASRRRSPSPPAAPRRSRTSGSATAIDIAGATAAELHARDRATRRRRRAFRVSVTNSAGTATSNDRHAHRDAEPAADRDDHRSRAGTIYPAGRRSASPARPPTRRTGPRGSRFTWRVDFHHATHNHPFRRRRSGTTRHVHDPDDRRDGYERLVPHPPDRHRLGRAHASTFRDVAPRLEQVKLATSPPGLQLRLDGQPVTAPTRSIGVVGIERDARGGLAADVGQHEPGSWDSWSDGGARRRRSPRPPATRPTRRPRGCAAPVAAKSTSSPPPRGPSPVTSSIAGEVLATAGTGRATAGAPHSPARDRNARELTRPAVRHAIKQMQHWTSPDARLGARRPERELHRARGRGRRDVAQQRLPHRRRKRAHRRRGADGPRTAGSRGRAP